MPLRTRASMSAWSSANAALVVKATRPASATANLLFRIIGFLSLVFDDHAVVQKEDPVVHLPGPLTFCRWIVWQLRTSARRRLRSSATCYHLLYQNHG